VWRTYIAVDDADAAVDGLVSAGATVRSAPANHGEEGRAAALTIQRALSSASGRPGGGWSAGGQSPGTWNFSDLHTVIPRRRLRSTLRRSAGRQTTWVRDVAPPPGTVTTSRQRSTDIRAGRQGGGPPGFEDAIAWVARISTGERPHWHVSFTVADRDKTAAEADRLGAQIVRQDTTEWTRTALVRDPQGAEFTVSQFAPPSG